MHDVTNGIVWIVWIVIGLPVAGGLGIGLVALLRNWALKSRELKVQEQKLKLEAETRVDELNAKILRMDDFGISPAEVASLAEEVRRLRQEVADLKQQMNRLTIS